MHITLPLIIFLFNFVVKFVFSLFFFLPSLSYFFIYYFSLNTRTRHNSQLTTHKSPFFFFLSFFPPQFSPPHIHTPPPHHTFHTYTLSFLVSLNIPLFYRSHIHRVCSFIFFFFFSQHTFMSPSLLLRFFFSS
jgi:hypothetical protein